VHLPFKTCGKSTDVKLCFKIFCYFDCFNIKEREFQQLFVTVYFKVHFRFILLVSVWVAFCCVLVQFFVNKLRPCLLVCSHLFSSNTLVMGEVTSQRKFDLFGWIIALISVGIATLTGPYHRFKFSWHKWCKHFFTFAWCYFHSHVSMSLKYFNLSM